MIMSSVNNAHCIIILNTIMNYIGTERQFWISGYVFVMVGGGEGVGGGGGGRVVADFRQYCETMLIKCKFCMCSISLCFLCILLLYNVLH